jgi:hypothetical protein
VPRARARSARGSTPESCGSTGSPSRRLMSHVLQLLFEITDGAKERPCHDKQFSSCSQGCALRVNLRCRENSAPKANATGHWPRRVAANCAFCGVSSGLRDARENSRRLLPRRSGCGYLLLDTAHHCECLYVVSLRENREELFCNVTTGCSSPGSRFDHLEQYQRCLRRV